MCTPAIAQVTSTFPFSIPQECFELARRERVPIVLNNKYQAAKAHLKLASLNAHDPLVADCRAAVGRYKAAMR